MLPTQAGFVKYIRLKNERTLTAKKTAPGIRREIGSNTGRSIGQSHKSKRDAKQARSQKNKAQKSANKRNATNHKIHTLFAASSLVLLFFRLFG